jgi:predicted ATPase
MTRLKRSNKSCSQIVLTPTQRAPWHFSCAAQTTQGRREPPEADFRKALTLVRSMGAKAVELLATMSLARLLRDTGRRNEAHSMLGEIYNCFTEGFDTPDLKDAKALLDELAT